MKCKSNKKQTPQRILTGANPKTGNRKGSSSILPGLLQPIAAGTKAPQQVEAHPGSESVEFMPSWKPQRPSGSLPGLKRCLLSCSNKSKVMEVPTIPSTRLPSRLINSPLFLLAYQQLRWSLQRLSRKSS